MDALYRAQHWSLQHQSYSWQEFRTYKLTRPCRQSRPDIFQPQLEGGRAYIWSRWKGLWLKLNWLFIGLLWCVSAICLTHRAGILPNHFSVNLSHLAPFQRAKKILHLLSPYQQGCICARNLPLPGMCPSGRMPFPDRKQKCVIAGDEARTRWCQRVVGEPFWDQGPLVRYCTCICTDSTALVRAMPNYVSPWGRRVCTAGKGLG